MIIIRKKIVYQEATLNYKLTKAMMKQNINLDCDCSIKYNETIYCKKCKEIILSYNIEKNSFYKDILKKLYNEKNNDNKKINKNKYKN